MNGYRLVITRGKNGGGEEGKIKAGQMPGDR